MAIKETPTHRVSRATLEVSARVGAVVSIYEIRLTAQEVKLRDWDNLPTLLRVTHAARTCRKADKGQIVVDAIFGFEMAHDNDESRTDPPVAIRAVFSLIYSVANIETVTDDDASAFGEANGVYNAWPFWRELVYSTLSRMGLPTITLPTFRVLEEETGAIPGTANPELAIAEQ